MQTNKALLNGAVIILIGFSCWLYMHVSDNLNAELRKEDQTEILQLRLQRKVDSQQVEKWRKEKAVFEDSVTGLQVQKGQVEIELNRVKEQLNQATANYKEKRTIKDTAKALVICDSIVYQHLPDYFRLDSEQNNYVDTLGALKDNFISRQGALLGVTLIKADTLLGSLIEAKEDNVKTKSDKATKKEQRKKIWGAGVIGAAIGVILVTLASLF